MDDPLLEFTVLSSSLTNCNDCDAALASFICDGKAEFFKSLKTDCAVDKLPEVKALPSEVRSLES